MKRHFSARTAGADLAVCILILAAVNIACMGFKKPWRDYSPRPFSSEDWLAGDKVERGRMLTDLFKSRSTHIGSREDAVKNLGEPDLKKTIENREVWFYRMDLGIPGAMDVIPISFDDKGRGSTGYAHGGTMSMAAKESEL